MFRLASPPGFVRSTLLASAAVFVSPFSAEAQTERSNLPPVTVTAPEQKRAATVRPAQQSRPAARAAHVRNSAPASAPQATGLETPPGGSLTVPNTAQARANIERTPGGVEVVPDTAFKNGPANTIKDVLGWVPGVIAQPRWGPDGRVSIRGSGLTRSYGNRGINVYMDGIPINTADGLFDLFEIDPTAYRYVEVYKGANALRYGANSLGGAINFVTPTGRDASPFDARVDAGSFGFVRGQASTGGANGPFDWFVTGSAQREDGYREHSNGHMERLNANVGYQFSPDAETRFYVNANSWRAAPARRSDQERGAELAAEPRIPSSCGRTSSATSTRSASPTRPRCASAPTTVDFGIFTHQRHVDHPIFRYLDYTVADYGGFARATDDRIIGGFRNRLVAGVNVLNGTIDYQEYVERGRRRERRAGVVRAVEIAELFGLCREQLLRPAERRARCRRAVPACGPRPRRIASCRMAISPVSRTFDIFSPKVGVLWDVDPTWQVFGNISRSAEVPTFDVNTFATPGELATVNAQTATTYEIGTRGRRPDFTWDISLYRAELRNELQCLTTSPFSLCTVVNADRTVHQGVEAGLGVAFLKSIFAAGGSLLVQPRLHLQRLLLRRRRDLGQQPPARRAAALRPRRSALQASERLLRGSERRVDAAGLLRRQRQHPHGRPVRAV